MMRAGRYYVGDLSYVLDCNWPAVYEVIQKQHDGEHALDGIPFAAYMTRHPSGTYHDQEGREYSVDEGIIGCVDAGYLLQKEIDEVTALDLGHFFEFPEDFFTGSKDGVLTFGHIAIDTDPLEDEEEDV